MRAITQLPTPAEIKESIPLSKSGIQTVLQGRRTVENILTGEDKRFLLVVGPCSIHNTREAFEYAQKLAGITKKVQNRIFVVMRLCGDKPRTGKAWTGFLQDPRMDGSCDIASGWREFRALAIKILDLELSVGCEILDAENYQRIDDLPSYGWIGARNVGGQRERQIASGLSIPTGFKNHPVGGIRTALDAMSVSIHSNIFAAPNDDGVSSRFVTDGNQHSHLILRGMDTGPNYDEKSIETAIKNLGLGEKKLLQRIVVDASHGNSRKNHLTQRSILCNVLEQRLANNQNIVGVMYESYLLDGSQTLDDPQNLKPGISVTDSCDGWERTEETILKMYEMLG